MYHLITQLSSFKFEHYCSMRLKAFFHTIILDKEVITMRRLVTNGSNKAIRTREIHLQSHNNYMKTHKTHILVLDTKEENYLAFLPVKAFERVDLVNKLVSSINNFIDNFGDSSDFWNHILRHWVILIHIWAWKTWHRHRPMIDRDTKWSALGKMWRASNHQMLLVRENHRGAKRSLLMKKSVVI